MNKLRIALAAATVAALGIAGGVSAMSSAKLTGTTGPGFTITLKPKTVTAGKHTFSINDKSSIHNFRLRGPGVNKQITTVGGTGTKTVTLLLKKGTYTFVCDPHASSMRGTLKVT